MVRSAGTESGVPFCREERSLSRLAGVAAIALGIMLLHLSMGPE